jgi:hypothetical protein
VKQIEDMCNAKAREKLNQLINKVKRLIVSEAKEQEISCQGGDVSQAITSLIAGTGNDMNLIAGTSKTIMQRLVDEASESKAAKGKAPKASGRSKK